MEKVIRDLFGDEPTVAPAMVPEMPPLATAKAGEEKETDPAARQATRQERQEFVARYTTGDPSEGFTTDEALTHLREMSEEMSPAEFRRAMERTLEHLPPSQREDFIKIMQEYQASQPGAPATETRGATAAAPLGGLLSGLMGGGGGSAGVGLDDLIADLQKGGLRGASAPADQPATAADFQALLDSPLARAVLGGVAAFGMQDQQDDDKGKPKADQAT
jgi:hypothetical protein